CKVAGALLDELLERLTRHEGIDQPTVERLGGPLQSPQCDAAVDLCFLNRQYTRLADAQAIGELLSSHTERFSNSPEPAVRSANQRVGVFQCFKAFIELPTGRGSVLGTHHIACSLVDRRNNIILILYLFKKKILEHYIPSP